MDEFDFTGDDSPIHYATSVVCNENWVGYVIAVVSIELEILTVGTLPINEYTFAETIMAFNGDLRTGKDSSLLVVSNEAFLSRYALMQIVWDEVVIDNANTPSDVALQSDWYPFHFNFSPLERMAWNQLVKVVLGRV
jgi:hypothetical protein